MLLTDHNGPCSSTPRPARSRRFLSYFQLFLAAILLLAGGAVNASATLAQKQQAQQAQENQQDQQQPSVADAARQERARKQEQQKTAKHIYTEEDLKRARILTPEDQAAVEARKTECAQNPQKNNCAPSPSQNPGALDANSQQRSLGEVARQIRKEKELQALQPKQSQPFHLSIGDSALAAPIVPEHPALRQPTPPVLASGSRDSRTHATTASTSGAHANVSRRDPFAPVPTRPRVPFDGSSQLHPAPRPSTKIISPAAPKISGAPVMPSTKILTPPTRPEPVAAPPPPENSRSRKTLNFEPVRPKTASKTAHPKDIGQVAQLRFVFSPMQPLPVTQDQPTRPPFEIEAVRPALPSTNVRPVSPTAPANIFYALKPLSLLESTNASPTAPATTELPNSVGAERSSAKAGPAVAKVRPSQPVSRPAISPAPSSPVAPVAPALRSVRVQPGDSLWKLARHSFGRGNLWPQILSANPAIVDPSRLPVGTELLLPNLPVLPPSLALANPALQQTIGVTRSTLRVRRGDTLWGLAKQLFGNAMAWSCLAAANSSVSDPNRIFDGQQLSIPAACGNPRHTRASTR
jgi:nucleoid-associated protein YgaU